MSRKLGLISAGIVLAAAACHTRPPRQASPQAGAVLEVQNDGTMDMTMYAWGRGASRSRLGTAFAHRRSWFTIPQELIFGLTPLQFQADPVGAGARPLSHEIMVAPGDTVVFHIPPGD